MQQTPCFYTVRLSRIPRAAARPCPRLPASTGARPSRRTAMPVDDCGGRTTKGVLPATLMVGCWMELNGVSTLAELTHLSSRRHCWPKGLLRFTKISTRQTPGCLVAAPCQTRSARLSETSGASSAGTTTKQPPCLVGADHNEPQ